MLVVLGNGKKLGLLREQQIQQIGETIASRAQPFATVAHFHGLYLGRSARQTLTATLNRGRCLHYRACGVR
jgi:hypothetical protein